MDLDLIMNISYILFDILLLKMRVFANEKIACFLKVKSINPDNVNYLLLVVRKISSFLRIKNLI